MKFLNFCVLLVLCPTVFAQTLAQNTLAQNNVLTYVPPKVVTAKAGGVTEAVLFLKLDAGYHVNSNTPSGPFLIPLRLTWNQGPLETVEVVFPPARTAKFGFSETPLSVFTGEFNIVTRFKVPSTAGLGAGTVTGKLRYQACDDHQCLTPKTIEVKLPIEIVK